MMFGVLAHAVTLFDATDTSLTTVAAVVALVFLIGYVLVESAGLRMNAARATARTARNPN
jgi:hypothetical protein